MHLSVYLFCAKKIFLWLIKKVCTVVGEIDLILLKVIITEGVMTLDHYVFFLFHHLLKHPFQVDYWVDQGRLDPGLLLGNFYVK